MPVDSINSYDLDYSLELLLALDLLAFGGVLEVRVDLRPLGFVERQLREAAFVVDGHRGAASGIFAFHGSRPKIGHGNYSPSHMN